MSTTDVTTPLRTALLETFSTMDTSGLNRGTSGNASVRLDAGSGGPGFLITPSGRPVDSLIPTDLAVIREDGSVEGEREPSSEWRLHSDIYAAFPDAGAVLHAHSPFATSLACQRLEIPAFHYLIALFGGSTVRCAKYATFGTQALSDAAVSALTERRACLLANHGMVVHGRNLAHALSLAVQFETLCGNYWRTCQVAPPVLLTAAEMVEATEQFARYARLLVPHTG
ncbi:MAG: class II aldolase/adducin family protein [Propionicimonas sp.]